MYEPKIVATEKEYTQTTNVSKKFVVFQVSKSSKGNIEDVMEPDIFDTKEEAYEYISDHINDSIEDICDSINEYHEKRGEEYPKSNIFEVGKNYVKFYDGTIDIYYINEF